MKPLPAWQAALLRSAGSLTAPGGRRGSLLVLIYHRVLPRADALLASEPDAATFAAQMDLVASLCRVLPLSEGVERLLAGTLPARAACITLDDGYANNLTVAAPILAQRRLPATVFVATGFIRGGCMWNDVVIESVRRAGAALDLGRLGLREYGCEDERARRAALEEILGALRYRSRAERDAAAAAIAEQVGCVPPDDLMMSEPQIRQLRSFGIAVGAHTMTHPILARTDPQSAREEVLGSKRALEDITGEPVLSFAYPNGRPGRDYDASHVELVRRGGFTVAVSTAWGAAGRAVDRLQVPRALPWDRSPLRFGARLLTTYRQQQVAVA
jgi:peptidoglycan/xylan/chitin deacetylase (PgdA/CDA1 family)